LLNNVEKYSVYARVSPEHKIRIVNAWQEKGFIVAMTGDGVNDAPALKQADIGVSMGKVGTEVAKDASSMILADDNFATIVKAVSNGRSIYRNIKHAIKFLLSGNTAGILAVLYTSIANLPLPFSAIHLLFINLLTDSLPAIALGLEPHDDSVMKEKPRSSKESLLNRKFSLSVIFEGFIIAMVTMGAFYYGYISVNAELGSTMAFLTLSLSRLLHGFNCRSDLPLFKIGLLKNKFQWLAVGLGVILLTIVIILEPARNLFNVYPKIYLHIHIVVIWAFISMVLIQFIKVIKYIFIRNSKRNGK